MAEEVHQIDLKGLSVCIAIPAYDGTLPVETATQLAQAAVMLRDMGIPLTIISERGNGLVDVVRNTLVKRFLEETDCNRLLFVDNDIVFKAEDAIRLLAWSTFHDVVGATYPIKRDKPVGFFVQPMSEGLKQDKHGLIKCKGFGSGFVVISRQVFKKMALYTEDYEMDGKFTRFYQTGVVDGKYRGEDLWFFRRWVDEFGGTIMLDPQIELQHVGKKYYDYKFKDMLTK